MGKCFSFKENSFLLKLAVRLFILIIFLVAGTYLVAFLLGPPTLTNDQNTIYYSQADEVIGYEQGLENRYSVNINDISPDVIAATLAIEDQNFYNHYGFDLKRMIRAIIANLQSLSLKEGASTLTQQYARNLFLSHEKTWTRKIKEAFYAIRLELFYSKEEILIGYLNTIYYGDGAYGIEAASNHYFNKTAHELSLAEATMLVGIPKGPSYYSPTTNYDLAKGRQQSILTVLLNKEAIAKEAYERAIDEELILKTKETDAKGVVGPYFQDTALTETSHILQIDKDVIQASGFKIYTTLNTQLQNKLEETITNIIDKKSEINVGATAMNPITGEIEALVGGRDYDKSPFNRAITAKRMPGSTFKPFLYYEALNNNYTPSTKLLSKQTAFVLENDEIYKPRNFNGYYANKPITLAQAIALSDNIYAVKTNIFLGPEKLVDAAQTFGITSPLPVVPSLALGTASVSVYEMVTAYGMLANGGREIHGHMVRKIIDKHGTIVYERTNKPGKQKLDPKNTFILTHLLTGMFDPSLNGYMSVTGSSIANKLTQVYAGKSGSTPFDSWMIGYSPSLVTGIWTGYDNNDPIDKVSDTTYAKMIWADFMEAAHKEDTKKKFTIPQGLVHVEVDPETGERATPYCPSSRTMYFVKGTEPTTHCQEHFPDEERKTEQEEDIEDKGFIQRLFDLFTSTSLRK